MMVCWRRSLRLILTVWLGSCTRTTTGFAFAPNFITKIISEDTKIQPQGLLEVNQPEEHTATPATEQEANGVSSSIVHSFVKTRFPPEPNGFLHLGHAKSVTFNFAVARMFGGTCNMRMDDTNPSKEEKEYVDGILEDVQWLQSDLYDTEFPWDGPVRKTSDYFEFIYQCAIAMIESGDAYVDSLSAEQVREYRGTLTSPGRDSPDRNRPIAENLQLFSDMRAGKYGEGEYILRAKIAMDSPNINMRDPTLYRIKHESHPETGDDWCIYPMYDFSHPIADAVENITHSLCTLEFEDHRPFYEWTIETLRRLGKLESQPQQIEFSRLNIQSTVLSKRKLIQLVREKHVTGWDDPRLPTISGLRRRGIPAAALRNFCEQIGISKSDSNIAMSVLEDCVRKTMDPICPRAMAVIEPLKLTIENYEHVDPIEYLTADRHPQISEMGVRRIPFGKSLYIERSDFFDTDGPEGKASGGQPPEGYKRLLPGGLVRLRQAYIVECTDIIRHAETNEPIELICRYLPDTRSGAILPGMKRVKGIIHWVDAIQAVPCTIYQYDRLFRTEDPGRDSGDFLQDINPNSLSIVTNALVEPSVAKDAAAVLENIRAGKTKYASTLAYQFERVGYFALDSSTKSLETLAFNRVVTLRDTWGRMEVQSTPKQQHQVSDAVAIKSTVSESPVEDILRPAFRAATILSVSPHPEADSLLVCAVDCGDRDEDGTVVPRTAVAGLARFYETDELLGRKVVAVTNLKPTDMRGVESTTLILAASTRDDNHPTVEVLEVPNTVANGELLWFDGKPKSQPDGMMKSKGAIKAWSRAKDGLRLDNKGHAVYREGETDFVLMSSEGPISSRSLSDAQVG